MKRAGDYSIGSDKWNGLSKLIEEAGEVLHVAGKIIGSDGDAEGHWSGNLRVKLVEELGDLLAAVDFFREQNLTAQENVDIARRCAEKHMTVNKWNKEAREND